MRFSASTQKFYPDGLIYPDLPDDVVPVSMDAYTRDMSQCEERWVVNEHGQLVGCAVSAVKLDICAAKEFAMSDIDFRHAEVLQMLVGSPTQVEKDTWALKLGVAQSIAGEIVNDAGAAFLDASGIAKCDQADWANRVLGRAATYAKVVGIAEAWRSSARVACQACADVEKLLAEMARMNSDLNSTVSNLLKV